jgi:hypothetical protein
MATSAAVNDEGVLTVADFRRSAEHPRREQRTSFARRVALLPYVTKGRWQFDDAMLADCSPHGVGLFTTAPMASGEQFLLKLRAGGTLLLVIYTVKHCHPAPPGSYRIGAEFSGFLRTGELESASDLFRVLISLEEASHSAAET